MFPFVHQLAKGLSILHLARRQFLFIKHLEPYPSRWTSVECPYSPRHSFPPRPRQLHRPRFRRHGHHHLVLLPFRRPPPSSRCHSLQGRHSRLVLPSRSQESIGPHRTVGTNSLQCHKLSLDKCPPPAPNRMRLCYPLRYMHHLLWPGPPQV